MNESHSKAINQKFNDFSAKIALASTTSIDTRNIKNNARPIPIYIYDAPNGLGLSILQAIFQIVINPFHSSHIYSAYILPDNLNRIFFEALDLKSVRKVLHYISGIKSVPKNLPVIRGDQINLYFVNPVSCLHFHPGQIVTIINPEFDKQVGQIVDIKKETGKLLIKTYPHIDYNFLRKHPNYTTQSKINESKGPDYKAPMVPFEKDGLITTNSFIPIWNNQVNGVKWDNKFFIGKFQYIWISNKEIYHKNLESITDEEKRIFSKGITDYERMNPSFMKGFTGQLNFEGTHDSDIILPLSLNKGKPSWANKNIQNKQSSSDSSSDSEMKPRSSLTNNINSKSQSTKRSTNLPPPSQDFQFSQSRKAIIPDFNFNSNDSFDSTPALPDFDDVDDDDNIINDYQRNSSNKKRIPNSPVFVGSSSSDEDEELKNSKNKSKEKSSSKSKTSEKSNIIDSSSDSDIDSLFETSTNKKTKSSKKTSSKQTSQTSKTKTKSNSSSSKKKNKTESSQKERSKTTEKNKSVDKSHFAKFFSSDLSSDAENENKDKEKSQPKSTSKKSSEKVSNSKSSNNSNKQKQKNKDFLADSSNSNSDSHPKSFIDTSTSSNSSDVEIIEKPQKRKKGKKKKEKENMKPIINELMKDSVDFGDSPPSEKTYFRYVSSSENEDDKGVEFEPTLDKETILEELSQQISKKKMRKYYKRKGMPVPKEYASDSYSLDSESSSTTSSSS